MDRAAYVPSDNSGGERPAEQPKVPTAVEGFAPNNKPDDRNYFKFRERQD